MATPLVRPIRLRSAGGAEAGRRVTWLELFFDLSFVAAVAQVGSPLATSYTPEGLARYVLLFLLVWWAWLGHTLYATRFDTDDVAQRLLTLAQIFGVAVMAVNADDALHSRSSAGFAAAYAGLRFILAAQYLRARRVDCARGFATWSACGIAAAAVLWLVSALAPLPFRYALWAMALAVDVSIPLVTARYTPHVPPDAAHLPERFGLFTIILLGESLVAVMSGMKSQEDWTWPAASSAVLGLALVLTLWWWYFDGAEAAGERHIVSRDDARRFHGWTYAHLPLYLGIGITGVGVEHVIRIAPSAEHLHATEAYMLCGALASTMLAMSVIAALRPAGPNGSPWRGAYRHVLLAAATGLIAIAAPVTPPAALLFGLAVMAIAQLALSLHHGSGSTARLSVLHDHLQRSRGDVHVEVV